jgi:hypothetical protein
MALVSSIDKGKRRRKIRRWQVEKMFDKNKEH